MEAFVGHVYLKHWACLFTRRFYMHERACLFLCTSNFVAAICMHTDATKEIDFLFVCEIYHP